MENEAKGSEGNLKPDEGKVENSVQSNEIEKGSDVENMEEQVAEAELISQSMRHRVNTDPIKVFSLTSLEH